MRDAKYEILVWLAKPLGDAILCTPALRAIRQHFKSSKIYFLARPLVRQVLSPSGFNDEWIEIKNNNPFDIAKKLKKYNFTHAVLFKNSFASALACFLVGIPSRIGYAREGRGFLLTEKLYPPKLPNGRYKPISMIDYYLAIVSELGADVTDRGLELHIDQRDIEALKDKLPEITSTNKPIVILVPGGAFGLSKCWPSKRFAQTADWLIDNYNAIVIVSVSPNIAEKQIAKDICNFGNHRFVNLAERPLTPGELKAFFSKAELVISNDTGPRHIAIALGRKVITLFGPNDPAWTDTDYKNEIQIVGNVTCAPCTQKICKKPQHLCMQAITVEMVCNTAKQLLEERRIRSKVMAAPEFIEISKSFFVDTAYQTAFDKLGLKSIDDVFSFSAGKSLSKDNLASFRSRLQFETNSPSAIVFLKRYNKPPILVQLKNWLSAHRRISCGLYDLEPTSELSAAGINTPKIVSYGQQWGSFFEKRSFIITEKIPKAESLERKLPNYFDGRVTVESLKKRRNFIRNLASFIERFHQTNYYHRDLYFSHIFCSDDDKFYLIDLARVFKPIIFKQRFKVKDIAQIYYSAPSKYFSNTDRMRFYLHYTGHKKLTKKDKVFIHKVSNKVQRILQHDRKHGRTAPFANR